MFATNESEWKCCFRGTFPASFWFSSIFAVFYGLSLRISVAFKKKGQRLLFTRCVENVPRLTLYLPRGKRSNEALILFKIRGVLKKYRDWSCISSSSSSCCAARMDFPDSRPLSLSSIAFGWPSRLHTVSLESCCRFKF